MEVKQVEETRVLQLMELGRVDFPLRMEWRENRVGIQVLMQQQDRLSEKINKPGLVRRVLSSTEIDARGEETKVRKREYCYFFD